MTEQERREAVATVVESARALVKAWDERCAGRDSPVFRHVFQEWDSLRGAIDDVTGHGLVDVLGRWDDRDEENK